MAIRWLRDCTHPKNLLMPFFLMGCFPVDFHEVKRPLRMKSGKRPIKVGKRPIKDGKRPIKAMRLVGISVGCLMGCCQAPPSWRKTAPLKRAIERSMSTDPVLASDCRAQLGHMLTRSGVSHLCDNPIAGPAVRRDNVLAIRCENPFLLPPFQACPTKDVVPKCFFARVCFEDFKSTDRTLNYL